jgi:hypothetical protein
MFPDDNTIDVLNKVMHQLQHCRRMLPMRKGSIEPLIYRFPKPLLESIIG